MVNYKIYMINYGGMAEWLKAADCKSAHIAYVGSNPTPTTKYNVCILYLYLLYFYVILFKLFKQFLLILLK